MTQQDKQLLVNKARINGCTLNGKRAIVSGVRNNFATVWVQGGASFDWSWNAVERILNNGGNFKS
jgi:hypothetical protein